MKYRILLLLIAATALFGGTRALMQQGNDKALGDTTGQAAPDARDALPNGVVSQGNRHKIIITAENQNVYDALAQRGGIVREIDYGSFKLVIADENSLGGRQALGLTGAEVRDEMNLIALNSRVIDTIDPAATYANLPADLRAPDMARAQAEGRAPQGGLYLVQFVGPIKDEWLADLKASGAQIVSYVPNNAYVVRADATAAAKVNRLTNNENVQFVGDYEPAFRIDPELEAHARASNGSELIDVTVQLVYSRESKATLSQLKNELGVFVASRTADEYVNVDLRVPAYNIARIAQLPEVFAIEERTERRKLDEAQGQIVAGNLSGNTPTGPGYLTFLANKGFNSSQFTTFAVNVADDAYVLTGHPDLPSGRIAFQNNPTSQAGAQGGHGFLNSHIVGGFNSGTGSSAEDASGYNYGLGIAPWSRVGITAIFGNGASSPTAWESTAYGQGSRISSNSWGFTGAAAKKYDTNAQEFDRIVRDAQSGTAGLQQLAVVFAAGNDGSGANTVSSPATAKNIITVGASENVRQTGTDGCAVANTGADSANDIINFSSRGPVNSAGGDGRIKPDIVAPGTHIEAGIPQSNYDGSSVCNQYWPAGQTLYGWSSGTSHSCPAVAGGSALVYQDFINKGSGTPSPAMIKALLMNSAAYMSGTGAGGNLPSNNQGMGRMDLGRAFDGSSRILVDQSQVLGATGQTYQTTGTVASTSQPLRVSLVWTDAPGPTTGAPYVNNLDLEVTVGGTTYKGNVFSGANSVSGGTADARNNAESVFLPAGTSGSFTVTVRGANIAGDGVPGNADTTDQDFALVVYNANSGGSVSPTIGVSPSSFSFSGTAGGASPASQSLSITNTGGGTLNWTASDNASWLTISPTSGTAPSTVTVSASTSGLAAGTYNGAITVTATGATNSPVTVPVTLTVNPSGGGSQLITNGGFETGTTPWVFTGASRSTGAYPHSGTAYAICGGVDSVAQDFYQQIAVPSGSSAQLNFWLNISTAETTTTTQYDRLFVEVTNTAGTTLGTLATFSNLNGAAAGTYTLRGNYSLASYAGQTVRVRFRCTTDSSLITSFRVDDVSAQ